MRRVKEIERCVKEIQKRLSKLEKSNVKTKEQYRSLHEILRDIRVEVGKLSSSMDEARDSPYTFRNTVFSASKGVIEKAIIGGLLAYIFFGR